MAQAADCVKGHTAHIYDRGGINRLMTLDSLSSVVWERDRDGVAEGVIKIAGENCSRQRDKLNGIIEKRHELVIFRGDDRVFEGPIFYSNDEGSNFVVRAKDVAAYLFATPLTKEWDNRAGSKAGSTTMTGRFEQIIAYELTHSRTGRALGGQTVPITAWELLDPPVNILPFLSVHHWPNEARTAAFTRPFEMTVGEHLANAARSGGIDFVTIGRAIHIFDTSRGLGQTRTLTEKDFFGPIFVTAYGADHTQLAYVSGSDGVYGEAVNTENLDLYGPWTNIFTSYNEEGSTAPTQSELISQAARNAAGRSPVPREVRVPDNSSVRLNETLTIKDLVPGARVPLRATLNARTQPQLQKLDHVTVTETAAGETVQITLSPATREDSDTVTP